MIDVNVFMSTYNGEKYLREQLDSILNQEEVKVNIFVRDDGSKDHTVGILKEYKAKGLLEFYIGENIGYKKSFMELVKTCQIKAQYYAFSDQDDVWLSRKLITAIDKMNNNTPFLYCSNCQYVGEDLKNSKNYHAFYDNLTCDFIKPEVTLMCGIIATGNTMVWNDKLNNIIINADYDKLNSGHDNLMSQLSGLVGEVYKDKNKTILYRQHSDNAGGIKNIKASLLEKMKNKIYNFLHNADEYETRLFIKTNFYQFMNEECKQLLENSLNYRESINNKNKFLNRIFKSDLPTREKAKISILCLFNKY